MNAYSIHPLQKSANLRHVRQHYHLCFGESFAHILDKEALRTLQESLCSSDIGGLVPGGDEHVVLASQKGQIVGAGVWAKRAEFAYIWGLYVRQTHQRQGVGGALMKEMISLQPARTTFELSVLHVSTAAIRLYQKLGFEKHSEVTFDIVPGQKLKASAMIAEKEQIV